MPILAFFLIAEIVVVSPCLGGDSIHQSQYGDIVKIIYGFLSLFATAVSTAFLFMCGWMFKKILSHDTEITEIKLKCLYDNCKEKDKDH